MRRARPFFIASLLVGVGLGLLIPTAIQRVISSSEGEAVPPALATDPVRAPAA